MIPQHTEQIGEAVMGQSVVRVSNDDLPMPRLRHAVALQKKGLTMTEIAAQMHVGRAVIEEALYWRVVRHG